MCSRYGQDPAEIVGIRDDYLAWCFRGAVLAVARSQEGKSPGEAGVDDLIAQARAEGGI